MKRCPECCRVYADETFNFCLDDPQGEEISAAGAGALI
jgi:hypothetical protein